jgi:hypothetical protein
MLGAILGERSQVGAQRLLLCRPQGGLNDMLCQIERSCRYAERFDRTVVVEADCRSTHNFKDSLAKYFVSQQARLVLDAAEIRGRLDTLEVYPHVLRGRVNGYEARFDAQANYIDAQTGQRLSFDLDRDYDEPLLVHHQSGGGQLSLGALARMRLHEDVVDLLLARLRITGPAYSSIHIRNTDLRTDYQRHVRQWADELKGPIFVATDNRETLAECRRLLGEHRVHAFARLPAQPGRPLHYTDEFADRFPTNADSILDLVMLGLATDFRGIGVEPNAFGIKYSGFSMLAANLQNAKPILARLIARRDPVLDAMLWPFE